MIYTKYDPDRKIIYHIDHTKISLRDFKELSDLVKIQYLHRDNSPAIEEIKYNRNFGKGFIDIKLSTWVHNGIKYNPNGPSFLCTSLDTGIILTRRYTDSTGEHHCINGPALFYTLHYSNGRTNTAKEYWIWGKNYSEEEHTEAVDFLNKNSEIAFKLKYG